MFLGLAMSQEANTYFTNNLNKFIALSPCIYYESHFETAGELITTYSAYEDNEIFWTTSSIKSETEKWEEVQLERDKSYLKKWSKDKIPKVETPPQPVSVASQFYLE